MTSLHYVNHKTSEVFYTVSGTSVHYDAWHGDNATNSIKNFENRRQTVLIFCTCLWMSLCVYFLKSMRPCDACMCHWGRPSLFQTMACRLFVTKPLCEQISVIFESQCNILYLKMGLKMSSAKLRACASSRNVGIWLCVPWKSQERYHITAVMPHRRAARDPDLKCNFPTH